MNPISKKTIIQILTISFLAIPCFCLAQEETEEKFEIIDIQPTYPGGMAAFYNFVSQNLVYPEELIPQGINGKVLVQFVVSKQGEIIEEEVYQGVHELLDAEALRIIRLSPDWVPGRMSKYNKAYAVRIILPIIFKVPSKAEAKKLAKKRAKDEKKAAKQKNK